MATWLSLDDYFVEGTCACALHRRCIFDPSAGQHALLKCRDTLSCNFAQVDIKHKRQTVFRRSSCICKPGGCLLFGPKHSFTWRSSETQSMVPVTIHIHVNITSSKDATGRFQLGPRQQRIDVNRCNCMCIKLLHTTHSGLFSVDTRIFVLLPTQSDVLPDPARAKIVQQAVYCHRKLGLQSHACNVLTQAQVTALTSLLPPSVARSRPRCTSV